MTSQNPYTAPGADLGMNHSAPEPQSMMQLLFSFQGRIPRRLYWGVSVGMGAVLVLVMFAAMLIFDEESPALGVIMVVLYIPLLWVSFALQAKRWHDRDKSAWWILIGFVPLIGAIWAFVEAGCLRGTEGDNRFGADPT